jgi:hypothetical protein
MPRPRLRALIPLSAMGDPFMSTIVQPRVYRTSFGLFAACDLETYRKLKRIRHLAGLAEAERRRWDRSQRRLPHNRAFRRRRNGWLVREAVDAQRMIFAPFYELRAATAAEQVSPLPPDARLAQETELLRQFFDDYRQARQPKSDPVDLRPSKLTITQIDALLEQIEVWNLRR